MSEKPFNRALGLPLSRKALRVLKNAGIYAPAMMTLEHQHLAKRYVVRGLETGGAIPDLDRCDIRWARRGAHRLFASRGVNCGQRAAAVVIAPVLVRVDMLRKGRTYEVLITEHKPGGQQERLTTRDGKHNPIFAVYTAVLNLIWVGRTEPKRAPCCQRSIRL